MKDLESEPLQQISDCKLMKNLKYFFISRNVLGINTWGCDWDEAEVGGRSKAVMLASDRPWADPVGALEPKRPIRLSCIGPK